MNYRLFNLIALMMISMAAMAQPEQDVLSYIEKYSQLAIEEQNRLGVPAAITLAQGIHESAAGKSDLALRGNNHFGIKCKSNWLGDTMRHDDDKKQECFRKYISAEQSYIDHSDFLKGSSRYSFLFDLDITDYIGWASGLKRAGYATNPLYVRKLTDLVEKYELQKFTYEALKKKMGTPGEVVPEQDAKVNANLKQVDDPSLMYKGLRGFWAPKGELLTDKAVSNGIKYKTLLEFNDLPDAPLSEDMFLFLEKKRKTGTVEFHTVKEGETMQFISQKEAIQLKSLYSFNNMIEGEEPEIGEQLSLQYKSYGTPRLKPSATKANETIATATPKEVKSDVVQQEEEKRAVATEPVKEETKLITNPAILDLEKARRTEALLGNGSKLEEKVEVKVEPIKVEEKLVNIQYGNTPANEPAKAEVSKPIEVVEVKKEKPKAPKRTYNEPNVSESVKVLKEKFDEIVYTPLPERKPVTELPKETTPEKVITKSVNANTPKAEVKKDTTTKKIAPKTDPKIIEGKTAKLEKTNTGIVREVKKAEAKADAKPTDKKSTTDTKKKSTDDKKKVTEDKKKANDKEKTVASNKGKDAKKGDTKSSSKKETGNKKTDKKTGTKPEPKKKK